MPEVFVQTERGRSEINKALYDFWFIFLSVYSAVFVFRCCRLPYPRVSWFRFMFTLVRHSFASLIDKQLSRKTTLMFQDALLFKLFQRTLPHPFLFSFKSTFRTLNQIFALARRRQAGQYAFFRTSRQPITVRHDLKTTQPYNGYIFEKEMGILFSVVYTLNLNKTN